MRLHHLDRGKLTVLDAARQLSRGHEVQFVGHAGMLLLLDRSARIIVQAL